MIEIELNNELGVGQTQQETELIDSMSTHLSNGQPCLTDLFPVLSLNTNNAMNRYSDTVIYQPAMFSAFQGLLCDVVTVVIYFFLGVPTFPLAALPT